VYPAHENGNFLDLTNFLECRGPMKKSFCYYFQQNFICNTSGMPRTSALLQLMAEASSDHILFSVDYPYESAAELRNWFETVPISDETWRDLGYRNAIRLFKLPLSVDELDKL
jgi:2,3-dihydroxybenzoate decarboxylase